MKKRMWALVIAGVLVFNQAGMVVFAQEPVKQEQKDARGVIVTPEKVEIGSAANSLVKFEVEDDEALYTKVYAYDVKADGKRLMEGTDYILSASEPGSLQPSTITFVMLKEYTGIADRDITIQLDTDGYGEFRTTVHVLQKGSGSGIEQVIDSIKEISRETLEDKSVKVTYEVTGTAMDKVGVKAQEPGSLYWMAPISVKSEGTAEKQTVTVTFEVEFGKVPEGAYKVRFYPSQNLNAAAMKEITTVITQGEVKPEVDKRALADKIAEAKAIKKGSYTNASWNKLQAAITAAEDVNADKEATKEDVEAQVAALEAAIKGLQVEVKNPVIWEIKTNATELESTGGTITVNVRGEDLPETMYYTLREKKAGESYWTKVVTNKAIANPSETGGDLEIEIPENTETEATEWNVGLAYEEDSLYPTYMKGSVVVKAKVPQKNYDDVSEQDWYYDATKYVSENNIMTGLTETMFGPEITLKRSEFATILYRLNGEPEISYSSKFPDVAEGQWYTNGVLWANSIGVVGGYGSGLFGTDDNITREQMALMMYRYAEYKGYNVSETAEISSFADADAVSSYAKTAFEWAVGSKIINGKADNTLAPQGQATRAECATIMMKFMNKYGK